jgi:hypothetical protein
MSRRRIAAAMISLLAAGGLLAIPSATSAASNGPSKSSNSQSEKSDKEK